MSLFSKTMTQQSPMQNSSTFNLEDLSHLAANEALSISVGVQILTTLPVANLTAKQSQALQLLQQSAARLIGLIDDIKEMSAS